MGKKLGFTLLVALGAIAGYTAYVASQDGFSDDTKESCDEMFKNAKNVGNDIERTYTSIGNKKKFTKNSKTLGNSTMKLAEKTGGLVASASNDMYKFTKKQISSFVNHFKDDDELGNFDDLEEVNFAEHNLRPTNFLHFTKNDANKETKTNTKTQKEKSITKEEK